jgi:hypothetical protein
MSQIKKDEGDDDGDGTLTSPLSHHCEICDIEVDSPISYDDYSRLCGDCYYKLSRNQEQSLRDEFFRDQGI